LDFGKPKGVGVNAHFCDEFGNLKTFLLALPEHTTTHAKIAVADGVTEIIVRFNLTNKTGFFMCDNASNNNTCIQTLGSEFGFNSNERRLRCAGHIFNLVAKAIIWGDDEVAFQKELAGVEILAEELTIWRKKGPLGKFRNTVF
jgi:hypothetical protein